MASTSSLLFNMPPPSYTEAGPSNHRSRPPPSLTSRALKRHQQQLEAVGHNSYYSYSKPPTGVQTSSAPRPQLTPRLAVNAQASKAEVSAEQPPSGPTTTTVRPKRQTARPLKAGQARPETSSFLQSLAPQLPPETRKKRVPRAASKVAVAEPSQGTEPSSQPAQPIADIAVSIPAPSATSMPPPTTYAYLNQAMQPTPAYHPFQHPQMPPSFPTAWPHQMMPPQMALRHPLPSTSTPAESHHHLSTASLDGSARQPTPVTAHPRMSTPVLGPRPTGPTKSDIDFLLGAARSRARSSTPAVRSIPSDSDAVKRRKIDSAPHMPALELSSAGPARLSSPSLLASNGVKTPPPPQHAMTKPQQREALALVGVDGAALATREASASHMPVSEAARIAGLGGPNTETGEALHFNRPKQSARTSTVTTKDVSDPSAGQAENIRLPLPESFLPEQMNLQTTNDIDQEILDDPAEESGSEFIPEDPVKAPATSSLGRRKKSRTSLPNPRTSRRKQTTSDRAFSETDALVPNGSPDSATAKAVLAGSELEELLSVPTQSGRLTITKTILINGEKVKLKAGRLAPLIGPDGKLIPRPRGRPRKDGKPNRNADGEFLAFVKGASAVGKGMGGSSARVDGASSPRAKTEASEASAPARGDDKSRTREEPRPPAPAPEASKQRSLFGGAYVERSKGKVSEWIASLSSEAGATTDDDEDHLTEPDLSFEDGVLDPDLLAEDQLAESATAMAASRRKSPASRPKVMRGGRAKRTYTRRSGVTKAMPIAADSSEGDRAERGALAVNGKHESSSDGKGLETKSVNSGARTKVLPASIDGNRLSAPPSARLSPSRSAIDATPIRAERRLDAEAGSNAPNPIRNDQDQLGTRAQKVGQDRNNIDDDDTPFGRFGTVTGDVSPLLMQQQEQQEQHANPTDPASALEDDDYTRSAAHPAPPPGFHSHAKPGQAAAGATAADPYYFSD